MKKWGLLLLAAGAAAQSVPDSSLPPDAEIRRILAQRIDDFRQSVGIVVGVIEPKGRRIVSYGSLDRGDGRPLNGDTVFEIGSVTKVFTSLLLADMVQRSEVALDDPIAMYLPAGVRAPARLGRAITLEALATHGSGLPRLPDNMKPKDPANPYADYTAELLYQFLSGHQLKREAGSQFEYSNLGAGLLGHLLARRAGMEYEALVRSRILRSLDMSSTRITPTPEMKTRLAVGHNDKLAPVPPWDFKVLAGCGALRSSTNDLLNFLAANLGYRKSPLAPAMTAMLKVRHPAQPPGMEIGLGWLVARREGKEIVWHNGGTFGHRAFIGYDPKSRVGVVVLSNTFTGAGVDDIGMHLLDTRSPLIPPPKEHKEITIDPKLLDGYVGCYQLSPNFVLTVTRDDNRLFVQATGQSKFEVLPEGAKEYFAKVFDIQITFQADDGGRATGLILHQNGLHLPAKRIE